MSVIERSFPYDTNQTSSVLSAASRQSVSENHDDGLAHHHHWARDRMAGDQGLHPVVADAARVPTPSSALHDDIHYAAV